MTYRDRLRRATEADLDTIAALEAEAMGADAWSRELIQQSWEHSDTLIAVAGSEYFGEGAIRGYVIAVNRADVAELHRIGVSQAHRREGVGVALLEAVLNEFSATRADRILLEVRADNVAALAFYAAAGFVEVNRRPRYYNDGTAAVVLRRTLGKGCGSARLD